MNRISLLGFVRGLSATLIVIAVVVAIAYGCFCTQAGAVGSVDDGRAVVVVGRVRSAHGDGAGAAVYELEDPSGRLFVTTKVGPPVPGALVVVRGKKRVTDEGRPIVVEHQRVGTF